MACGEKHRLDPDGPRPRPHDPRRGSGCTLGRESAPVSLACCIRCAGATGDVVAVSRISVLTAPLLGFSESRARNLCAPRSILGHSVLRPPPCVRRAPRSPPRRPVSAQCGTAALSEAKVLCACDRHLCLLAHRSRRTWRLTHMLCSDEKLRTCRTTQAEATNSPHAGSMQHRASIRSAWEPLVILIVI